MIRESPARTGPPERATAPSAGGASPVEKERDVPSFHDYPGVQANEGEEAYNHSTDPGRIWTDKTVLMSDGDLAGQGESPLTVDDESLGPPNQLRPPAAVHDFVFAVGDSLVAGTPDILFVCAGSNDIMARRSSSGQPHRSPALPPLLRRELDRRIDAQTADSEQVCQRLGIGFVDVAHAELIPGFWGSDRFHPGAAGYEFAAGKVAEAMVARERAA
jgi:hypothetical protein